MFGDTGSRNSLSLDLDMSWGIVLRAYRCLTTDAHEESGYPNPMQEWGEEVEDGALYGVTLRRMRTESPTTDCLAVPLSPGYVHYKTCKVRTLRAGTLKKLVENLLVEYQGTDPCYVPTFLSTYRAFTTPEKVLELLLDRRLKKASDEEGLPPGSPVPDTPSVQRVVRCVLHTWLEKHPQDFQDSPHCLQIISSYLGCDKREAPNPFFALYKAWRESWKRTQHRRKDGKLIPTYQKETERLLETS
ncbi:hypothetical protein GDO86_006928 [Hymenochirus boettgeri]|uniref:N-terminal Ras-GEF domain-containing protein n=1 Tax=Hymenochirus boettgeri TaxID=247094 RepID=A0A8T2JFZ0_9PIPI|nr:hypothetical protein GDO86_006928 [Hymenochirus boettgeri]